MVERSGLERTSKRATRRAAPRRVLVSAVPFLLQTLATPTPTPPTPRQLSSRSCSRRNLPPPALPASVPAPPWLGAMDWETWVPMRTESQIPLPQAPGHTGGESSSSTLPAESVDETFPCAGCPICSVHLQAELFCSETQKGGAGRERRTSPQVAGRGNQTKCSGGAANSCLGDKAAGPPSPPLAPRPPLRPRPLPGLRRPEPRREPRVSRHRLSPV